MADDKAKHTKREPKETFCSTYEYGVTSKQAAKLAARVRHLASLDEMARQLRDPSTGSALSRGVRRSRNGRERRSFIDLSEW